jgi:hypothetical protein
MKWIGGVILLIITMILIVMAMFMFPWFSTKTEYHRVNIEESGLEYWEKLGDIERDWDKSTYGLTDYEMESSTTLDWTRTGLNTTKSSGKISYDSSVKTGGWSGSYRDMVANDYPVPGFLAGGEEQLNLYTNTFYILVVGILMSVISLIFIIIAGLGKLKAIIPKILVGITIIFVVIAPLYYALGLPPAIKNDHEKVQLISATAGNATESPSEGSSSIMGEANENSGDGQPLSSIKWGPELGWWLSVVAIFMAIITIGFVEGKQLPKDTTSDHMHDKYREFDEPPGRGRDRRRDSRGMYDQEYIPPPSRRHRGRPDDYYDDPDRGSAPPPEPAGRGDRGPPPPRPPRRNRPPENGH